MLITINDSLLNIKAISSMLIKYTPEKTTSSFFGMFKSTNESPLWTLELTYTCGVDGKCYIYSCSSRDKSPLTKIAKEFIKSAKEVDSSFIDKAFEDAFLKE